MRREVLLTADAERDLEDLYDYIVDFDSRVTCRSCFRAVCCEAERRVRLDDRM